MHEYKGNITLDVFKVKVNEIESDVLKTHVVETLKEVYKYFQNVRYFRFFF